MVIEFRAIPKPRFLVILAAALLISGCIQPERGPSKASMHPVSEAWKPDGIIGGSEYSWSMNLTSPQGYGQRGGTVAVYWRNDAQTLYIALKGQTRGWVALGFEPSEWMKDADMILGAVNDGNVTVQDQYSAGNYGPHLPDTTLGGTDDILEYGGREEGGYTTVEFKRRMNTGDSYDKAFAPGQTVKIIWAMADSDFGDVKHNVAHGEGVLTFQ